MSDRRQSLRLQKKNPKASASLSRTSHSRALRSVIRSRNRSLSPHSEASRLRSSVTPRTTSPHTEDAIAAERENCLKRSDKQEGL